LADPPVDGTSARRRLLSMIRLGLLAAALLMSLGFVVGAVRGLRLAPNETGRRLAAGHDSGGALAALGVLLLVLSPALQVLGLAVVWIRERDWKYVFIATVVATTLGVAVALGSR
jgi:hypothetical protein